MPKRKENMEQLLARYERLKKRVMEMGPVQMGTITERMDRRPDARGEIRERGPYYQWTFKESGRTRTVNLTREQARLWRTAIANHRKLEAILKEMREVSLRILKATTAGVPPRNRQNTKSA